MKGKHKILSTWVKYGISCMVLLSIAGLYSSCKPKSQQVTQKQSTGYYTCSMHPQVHEDHPGNCPICGMKLIKVEVASSTMASNKIVLTAAQIQLAGIQTDTVREQNTGSEKTLSGTVTSDETKSEVLSARISGRIQQLFVRTIGEKISVGQPVYSLYSEDLLETEKEYLLAVQQQKVLHNADIDYKQLIRAAENKLSLWGLTSGQLNSLGVSGKGSATINILSKVNGTVSEISVHEGDYVTEGMTVLKTESLSSLWVEAQLYADETSFYKANDQVSVSFPDLGGQVINGKIEFINPELSDASKVNLVRIGIPNQLGLLRPGMLAYISKANGDKYALAVPSSSIIASGKGNMVWVQNTDSSFSPRPIKTGVGNQNYISVSSGLKAGEVVVTRGAYLINSESIFKDGSSMSNMKM